jgi:gliding motility-associated-like protein/uncharacterized repeat protein (TIGR01451 family)
MQTFTFVATGCDLTTEVEVTYWWKEVAPVVVTALPHVTYNSADFASQQALDEAFATWLAGFDVTGGCNPEVVMTPTYPVAPEVCGGSVTVAWTVSDLCYEGSFGSGSFTVLPVTPVNCSSVNVMPQHVEGAPIYLPSVAGATPAGGKYVGPGVTGDFWFNPSVAGVGVHTIVYSLTHPNGCSTSCQFTIEVYHPSVAISKTASRTTFTQIGDVINYTIVVTNDGTFNLTNVDVSDPLIGLNQTIANLAPGASQTFTGSYTVTYNDMLAEKVLNTATVVGSHLYGTVDAEDGVMVILTISGSGIIVSDGFSPNGDGFTDYWQILGLDNFPNHSIKVFNRNGALVFESDGPYYPWNGVANRGHIVSGRGGVVPAGVYFYVITLEPGGKVESGAVHVLY